MPTTWTLLPPAINGDRLTITVQEVIDTIPGKTYSVTRPKNHPRSLFRSDLKKIILLDRADRAEEATETGINLAGFEKFLNS